MKAAHDQQNSWVSAMRLRHLMPPGLARPPNGLATVALALTLTLTLASAQTAKDVVVNEFSDEYAWSDPEIPQFNNLVVDKNTGRVYIGAVNKLYQLSPNLK